MAVEVKDPYTAGHQRRMTDLARAMATHRPYRAALGLDAALVKIEKNKGTLYDAAVVDICLSLFREERFQLEGT